MIPDTYREPAMNRDEQRRVAQRMVDLQLQREVWEAIDREYAKAGSDHLSDEVDRGLNRLQDRLFDENDVLVKPFVEAVYNATRDEVLGLALDPAILLLQAEFLRQFDGEPARMGDLMLAQAEAYLLEQFWLDVDSTFYRAGSRDGPLRINGEPKWVSGLFRGVFEDAETMAADWYDAWADKLQKVVDMPAWRRQDRQVQQNLVGFIRLMRDRAELFRNGPDPVTQRFFEAPDPDNSRPPASSSSSGGGGGGPATIAFALVATPPTVRVKRRAWFRWGG